MQYPGFCYSYASSSNLFVITGRIAYPIFGRIVRMRLQPQYPIPLTPHQIRMLRDIYLEFGAVGTLFTAVIIVGTTLSWFQAIAGLVVSKLPVLAMVGIIASVSIVPPLSLIVTGFLFFRSKSHSVILTKSDSRTAPNHALSRDISISSLELKPVASYARAS